jgi:hypothetical protein
MSEDISSNVGSNEGVEVSASEPVATVDEATVSSTESEEKSESGIMTA